MASNDDVPVSGFASPRITAEAADRPGQPGVVLLRSLEPLGGYPVTVVHRVREHAQLVPALEGDPEFAARFFSRLRLMFNAAAALPAALRDRLSAVAWLTTGREIPLTGSWGATETAPAVTSAHFAYADARCIGVPLPGTEVKLVPAEEGAYEIRVKGPNVTPGYFARPDLTRAGFDEEGFYRTGDAVGFADPGDPNAGLVFRGRLAEDLKILRDHVPRPPAPRPGPPRAAPPEPDSAAGPSVTPEIEIR